jgi:serine/threonine protein phosphatase 1
LGQAVAGVTGKRLPEPIANLRGGRPTWAVAAINGEAGRLAELHRQLSEKFEPGHNLVYHGNYFGGGEDVAGTVDALLKFRCGLLARPGVWVDEIVYLRGAHEEMWQKLLQIQFAPNPLELLRWMEAQGIAQTIAAYGGTIAVGLDAARRGAIQLTKWTSSLRDGIRQTDGHNAFMSSLKHACVTTDRALLFVHSGLDASRPLSEQGDTFWWGAADFDRIDSPYGDFKRVVRGNDPRHRGIELDAVAATIDGGCGFGGPLVAVCFDEEGGAIDILEA